MATSQEKVIAYYVSRLRDKRTDVRLDAIEQLQAMGADAETAMPALEECFKTAEEQEVKVAAQKAGLAIHMAVKASKNNDE